MTYQNPARFTASPKSLGFSISAAYTPHKRSWMMWPAHPTVARNLGFARRMPGLPKVEITATVCRKVALEGLEGMENRGPDMVEKIASFAMRLIPGLHRWVVASAGTSGSPKPHRRDAGQGEPHG